MHRIVLPHEYFVISRSSCPCPVPRTLVNVPLLTISEACPLLDVILHPRLFSASDWPPSVCFFAVKLCFSSTDPTIQTFYNLFLETILGLILFSSVLRSPDLGFMRCSGPPDVVFSSVHPHLKYLNASYCVTFLRPCLQQDRCPDLRFVFTRSSYLLMRVNALQYYKLLLHCILTI